MIAQIFQGLILVKIGVAVIIVVGLSLVAERVSPRMAGILSGYPLGSALSLFFIGYEISPEFAADSAIYTTSGLSATVVFVYLYYLATRYLPLRSKVLSILSASLAGMAGFLSASWFFNALPFSLAGAVVVSLAVMFGFNHLLSSVENVLIREKVRTGFKLLMVRALAAAFIIVFITSTARLVGHKWAGLLAAFPMTMYPFIVIIHATYRSEHVFTIIRNVPRGLVSLIVYCALVALTYPRFGLSAGTLIAYAGATAYLVLAASDMRRFTAGRGSGRSD